MWIRHCIIMWAERLMFAIKISKYWWEKEGRQMSLQTLCQRITTQLTFLFQTKCNMMREDLCIISDEHLDHGHYSCIFLTFFTMLKRIFSNKKYMQTWQVFQSHCSFKINDVKYQPTVYTNWKDSMAPWLHGFMACSSFYLWQSM